MQAEPGVDERALERLEARAATRSRAGGRNVFFGGVHAVARDPATVRSRRAATRARGRRRRLVSSTRRR